MYFIGEPDGATEDLSAYIPVGRTIAFDFSDLRIKAIVGRKGAGKSLCMRKFQDAALHNKAIYVIDFKSKNPDLGGLIDFSVQMDDLQRTNNWQKIWNYTIFLSAATVICFADRGIDYSFGGITSAERRLLKEDYSNCFFDLSEVTHPYDIIEVIISRFESYDRALDFMRSSEVKNFESRIRRLLERSLTLCFFLDALDEELKRAPALLIDIARALFYTAIHLARESVSTKLHVAVAIRDIVYSSIQTSEHGDRYKNSQYIGTLPWNYALVKEFANRKFSITIDRLKEERIDWVSGKESSLSGLLGFDKITNSEKGCQEDVMDYFIRHTNYVPRNVIRLGNRLFEEFCQYGEVDEGKYKEIVNEISRELADILIKIASAYLVSAMHGRDIKYLSGLYNDFTEEIQKQTQFKNLEWAQQLEMSQGALTDGYVEEIKDFIKSIGSDVFSKENLNKSLSSFVKQEYFENQNHKLNRIENILWTQGLIGYREVVDGKERDIFYYFSGLGTLATLPLDKQIYIFFPGLVDLCGLKVVRGKPIGGYLK